MASQTQPGTTTDVPNYVGTLLFDFVDGSPFISESATRNGIRRVNATQFEMSNIVSADTGAQDGATEDAQSTPTALADFTSYAATQTTQEVQSFLKRYIQSYSAGGATGEIAGVAVGGVEVAQVNSLSNQRMAHLRQLAIDWEWSALYGTSQTRTNAATAGAMGGLLTAVEAGSETAAGGAALSADLINTEVARMAAANAEFIDMWVAGNAFQIQQLNALYGNGIQSVTEAGVNITILNLPVIGPCKVLFHRALDTDHLAFVDLGHLRPVSMPNGRPDVSVEPLAKVGAGNAEMIYADLSIDYDAIQYHGMLTGLATS
jgi:hypothetical protein